MLILTTRPPLADFTFGFFKLEEERLTFATGFFFIELHLRNCRRGPFWNSLWKRLSHESTFIYEKRQCASTRLLPGQLLAPGHYRMADAVSILIFSQSPWMMPSRICAAVFFFLLI